MTEMPLRLAVLALLASCAPLLTGCATQAILGEEGDEPVFIAEGSLAKGAQEEPSADGSEAHGVHAEETSPATDLQPRPAVDTPEGLTEVVVAAKPESRHELIRDLVAEARTLLRDVELQYVFTGRGRREVLRGRPVAFALWSETTSNWTVAHVEIPRPPVRWRPGGRPLRFTLRAPGITARHVRGTGAERLMFTFSRGGDPLKVYGRKFPVFDNDLVVRGRWRAAVASARPIVYLPFTEDTLDPRFVREGREFLRDTAKRAIEELRAAGVPSSAFPDELLADVVPPEVIMTLAVIEQTDDSDYRSKQEQAFNDVLSHYGLKREEAYRYSVSRANAIGPMQFTDRRGNGTYSLVVRRCPGARLDPNFERGATNLLNAMKAAICLFDIELWQMPERIRLAYRENRKVLGIFPVAAYNGGPRNVARLARVIERMGIDLGDLRAPGEQSEGDNVPCPCLWRDGPNGVYPVTIPRYNNENRWYVEKYQSILRSLEEDDALSERPAD